MTPAQKIERAKQAERAHLLQTCMELGVEIFDVSGLCFVSVRVVSEFTRWRDFGRDGEGREPR